MHPFHVFPPSDIRTGFASGHTQLDYESHGVASGQRRESENRDQSSKATVQDGGGEHASQSALGRANAAKILRRTSRIYPGSLQGGGMGSFPSCVTTKLFITFHLLRK